MSSGSTQSLQIISYTSSAFGLEFLKEDTEFEEGIDRISTEDRGVEAEGVPVICVNLSWT